MIRAFQWVRRIWTEIDEESRAERRPGLDLRPLVVLVVVAISLTLQEYIGERGFFHRMFADTAFADSRYFDLWGFVWWSGWRVLGYVVIPLTVIPFLGIPLRRYHVSPRGFLRHLPLYVLLFALVLPLVYLMAHTKDFQRIYPFYKLAKRSTFDLWAWEALYAIQFLSLEFFFRGFILVALRPALGVHAIWVMIVPYCMIHYGKTMAETTGAIFAGIILGTIAMRTRSIWGGVAIHVGVALTMDLLCVRVL
jgi:membrane protease YdiL (CAAX protease family)